MAIAIEKSFTVEAAPEVVWAFLTDPHKVAECLPGAAVTEQVDDATYAGTMTVRVGPVSSSYKGKLHFDRMDVDARTVELTAKGMDVRGKGGADMRMTSTLDRTESGGTEAKVISEVNVTGILAQFGRGMIQDVSDQMFETFTKNMRGKLEPSEAAEPSGSGSDESTPASSGEATAPAVGVAPSDDAFDGVAFAAQVSKRTVSRWTRSPGFWIAVIVIVIVLYLLLK